MTSTPVDGGAVQEAAAPPRRRWLLPVLALTAGTAVLAAGAVVGWPLPTGSVQSTTFEVVNSRSGEVVYERALEVGATFTLRHRHSVTRRPVIESFAVADPSLLALEELWFDTHGPNLPAGADQLPHGVDLVAEDGAYRVVHEDTTMETVPMMVGSAGVDHQLTFEDGERLRLLDVAPAGTPVRLRVGPGTAEGAAVDGR